MELSTERFARLLTQAIRTIAAYEHKPIQVVQDELGYALGKKGGASIEYWRKGNLPTKVSDIEGLARELVRRRGIQDIKGLEQFLYSAGYPQPQPLLDQLAPLLETRFPAITMSPTPDDRSQNPFIVGPPITNPYQFFGRTEALERIFNVWRRPPLQNVAVTGLKRSGKTSLLHFLSKITQTSSASLRSDQRNDWLPQSERYRWVFVDFQDPRMGSLERLLNHLLTRLKLPVPAICTLHAFMDTVSEYLQTPAIILMDEIRGGLESPELNRHFWNSLRSLGTNFTGGNLAFLLTAHESPAKLAHDEGKTSPFFNIFGHTLHLEPLTEPEARELIAISPFSFDEADIKWILAQSSRWPCLLQSLCHTRFVALEKGEKGEDWKVEALRQIEPYRHLLATDV
jgi:hypothetical protein